jgi:hypothetical protein
MKKKYINSFKIIVVALIFCSSPTLYAFAQSPRVDTSSAGLTTKVAPGEILPISVKLLNFGQGQKVDVTVSYGIFSDKGTQIYSSTETVAVETTANFIKTIQIPFGTPAGGYVAKASILYAGQLVPATTQFPFTVENKIFGFFLTDFYFYLGVILILVLIAGFIGYSFIKRGQANRITPHEYNNVADKERIYYEIISDTIMEMRYRVGSKALEIAKAVEGLVVDPNTGKVLQITEDPAKIIASLVMQYEKLLGQKISFALKRNTAESSVIINKETK